MPEDTHLDDVEDLTPLAERIYRWWVNERPDWPLDRTLRVYLTHEEIHRWGTYDFETSTFYDGKTYDLLFETVLDHARTRRGQS